VNAQTRRALLIFAVAIAGCGRSPRLDTTNEETYKASQKAITADMTDAQKREFAGDIAAAIGPEAMQSGLRNTFSKDKSSANPTAMYKSLNGMTADEIHAKAEENRRKRAEGKNR
jgi:hypothetical protein